MIKKALIRLDKNDEDFLNKLPSEIKKSLIYKNLISSGINSINNISINDPFNNCAKFYKFPFNMNKNIMRFDE